MPKLTLYGSEAYAPVRAVLLTLRALQLDYDFVELQLNADGAQPKLVDGDEGALLESHAICAYLVRRYGGDDDRLYPRAYHRRALVDRWLHYETGVLLHMCHKPIVMALLKALNGVAEAAAPPPPGIQELARIEQAYARLELHLSTHKSNDGGDGDGDGELVPFVTGPSPTIADLCIVSSIVDFHAFFVPITRQLHPHIYAWLQRMQALPYYEDGCGSGVRRLEEIVQRQQPKQFDKLWMKAFTAIKSNNNNNNSTYNNNNNLQ